MKPIDEKIQAITDKLRLKNLKALLWDQETEKISFRINTNCVPLLKRDRDWNWVAEHEKAFYTIKKATKQMAELKHETHLKNPVMYNLFCHASTDGFYQFYSKNQKKVGQPHILHLCF